MGDMGVARGGHSKVPGQQSLNGCLLPDGHDQCFYNDHHVNPPTAGM